MYIYYHRSAEEEARRLERYECIISTSGGTSSSGDPFVAQSAASVMQIALPTLFAFFNVSSKTTLVFHTVYTSAVVYYQT